MPESRDGVAELLHRNSLSRSDCCGRKVLTLLFFLIGLIGLLGWVSRTHCWDDQHAAIQAPTVAMVSRFRPVLKNAQQVQAFPTSSNRFRSVPTAHPSWPYSHGAMPVNPVRATVSGRVPLHGTSSKTWVQPVLQQVQSEGKDVKLGWKNHPLITNLQNSPLSKRVLALGDPAVLVMVMRLLDMTLIHLGRKAAEMLAFGDRAVRQLELTLEHLGQKLLHISHLRDQVLRTFREYGAAGIISLLVGTIAYWLLVLLPASAYMFHGVTGAWLPTLSDPKSVAAFGKILGGVFLCTHLPPIEAARWAWVLSMVPWFQERLPPALKGAGDVNTMQPVLVDANSMLETRSGKAPQE